MHPRTFCVAPWVNVSANSRGHLRPCCLQHVKQERVTDYVAWRDNQYMRDLRRDLHHGVRRPECHLCWQAEDSGQESIRQAYNRELAQRTDLRTSIDTQTWCAKQAPISVDLALGNICNLKCVMCRGDLSSRIMAEQRQNQALFQELEFVRTIQDSPDLSWPEHDEFLDLMAELAPGLIQLNFTGGEPLLIKNVKTIIKTLPNPERATVNITTNGTVWLDDEWMEILSRYDKIWLQVSLEGIDQHQEYLRAGSSWPDIQTNIDRMQQLPNLVFRINHVLQWSSSFSLPALFAWAQERCFSLDIKPLYEHDHLSLSVLTDKQASAFLQWAMQQQTADLQPVVYWLQQHQHDPDMRQRCRDYFQTLEQIRKNHLADLWAALD